MNKSTTILALVALVACSDVGKEVDVRPPLPAPGPGDDYNVCDTQRVDTANAPYESFEIGIDSTTYRCEDAISFQIEEEFFIDFPVIQALIAFSNSPPPSSQNIELFQMDIIFSGGQSLWTNATGVDVVMPHTYNGPEVGQNAIIADDGFSDGFGHLASTEIFIDSAANNRYVRIIFYQNRTNIQGQPEVNTFTLLDPSNPFNPSFDRTLQHELGHALGIVHVLVQENAVMDPGLGAGEIVEESDYTLDTLQFLYDSLDLPPGIPW